LPASTGSRRRSPTAAAVCPLLLPLSPFLTHFPGTVFLGVHTIAGKEVAIKIEPAVARNSPLKQESRIYKSLMGGTGVPWIMWSGKQGDYNVMVIDLMGPSLEDLFKMCNRHFSLKSVLLLADQLVRSPMSLLVCLALIALVRYPASSSSTQKILYTATSSPQIS
jgi:serine/threonine protein kinase